MPSRAEMRIRVEQALRAIVVVALALMFLRSLIRSNASDASSTRVLNTRALGGGDLARWSVLAAAPKSIHLQIDNVPTPVERAWLGALAGSGSEVTWTGDLMPLMVDAQPIVAPTGGTKVLVAGRRGSPIAVGDEVGLVDTLRPQSVGAAVTLGSASDRITASTDGSLATVTQRDSVILRRVLVIGSAGWESKFVVAALEEKGWKVDALIRVAPNVDVTQGQGASIDTARYSAVIALDAAASPYANGIAEFVRNGGGVVLEPSAATLDAFSALRAGSVARASSAGDASQGSMPVNLASLPLHPITLLRNDAIPLEKRRAAVTSAARRFGAGRVLQLGYDDSWRWRMAGGDTGLRDHRQWWTRQVSTVAYAPRIPRANHEGREKAASLVAPTAKRLGGLAGNPSAPDDPAPLSDLVANIGPATSRGLMSSSGPSSDYIRWLFMLLVAALVAEVASRRTRGAA